MATGSRSPSPAARKPGRAIPKVSPLRGQPVEAWVDAKASGWQREAVTRLLALARRTAPGATVSIKWAQPVVELKGPIAFVRVAKEHVTFGFWRGAELPDPEGLLEGGEVMRHVKIRSLDGLDEPRLAALLRAAVALNQRLGDPTRRSAAGRSGR